MFKLKHLHIYFNVSSNQAKFTGKKTVSLVHKICQQTFIIEQFLYIF